MKIQLIAAFILFFSALVHSAEVGMDLQIIQMTIGRVIDEIKEIEAFT